MPRPSLQQTAERARNVAVLLHRAYPDVHCELNHGNPLELLIATILSAQCTDKQVNIVTADLFRKYRRAEDYVRAPLEELQNDIRRIGLYRAKGRNIQACCRTLVESHGGEVPQTMEQLTALGGVGRKTANVVLGNAFHLNVGIVVDTHVARLAQRLGFTREMTPEKIEQALMKLLARDQWCLFSHLLIWHGRRRCLARLPDCPRCEVRDLCPRIGVPRDSSRRALE